MILCSCTLLTWMHFTHASCLSYDDIAVLEALSIDMYCSDMAFKLGGLLSIEDSEGSIKSIYLEDGFFNFLNQVILENVMF